MSCKKTNSKVEWYIRCLNWCWNNRLAVTGVVTAIVLMMFWRFYLLNYEVGKGWKVEYWYKGFVEEQLWINILVFAYTIYAIGIWGYYIFRFKSRIWHVFIYGIFIAILWVVPALEPVKTPISVLTYHLWMTIALGIIAVAEIPRWIYIQCNKPTTYTVKNESSFLAEVPLEEHKETEWKNFIETLLGMFGNTHLQNESFAIGIAGNWGSGKTTFYNIVKGILDKDQHFGVCEFKPWQVINPADVAPQFFVTLQKYLIEMGEIPESDLISNINKYADVLKSLPTISEYAKPIVTLMQIHEENASLQALHGKIGDILAKRSYTTVVMIDDADRLNNMELLEVLRLIRVSANFKNVLFVITYDKDHIANLIGESGKEYLKKIVNVEIKLPPIENYKYTEILIGNIRSIVPSLSKDYLDLLRYVCRTPNKSTGNTLLNKYSHNFRDLLRFSNHFGLILNHLLKQNVLDKYNLFDLFWLEMVRYFDEDTYYILQEHPLQLLNRKTDSWTRQVYLVLKDDIKKSEDIKSRDILVALFDSDRKLFDENIIIWNNNFNNYFAYRLLDNAVSMAQFSDLVTETKHSIELRQQLDEWCSGHARTSLINVVNSYPHNNAFPSKQAALNYVRVLYHLLHKEVIDTETLKDIIHTKGHMAYFNSIQNDPFDNLLRKVIVMRHSIEWNYLLTSLCITEDKNVRDFEEYISFQEHVSYIINENQLKNLAKLNYELQFEGQIIPLRELFYSKNNHMRFIESLTYISKIEGEVENAEKQYSNLIGDYLVMQYGLRNQQSLGNKDFEYMYSHLQELSGADVYEEKNVAKSLMKDCIQQILGSVDNLGYLIKQYFRLNTQNKVICKEYLGLNI